MNCDEFKKKLEELVEQRRPLDDRQLKEHASACQACAELLWEAEWLDFAIDVWLSERVENQECLVDSLLAELTKQQHKEEQVWSEEHALSSEAGRRWERTGHRHQGDRKATHKAAASTCSLEQQEKLLLERSEPRKDVPSQARRTTTLREGNTTRSANAKWLLAAAASVVLLFVFGLFEGQHERGKPTPSTKVAGQVETFGTEEERAADALSTKDELDVASLPSNVFTSLETLVSEVLNKQETAHTVTRSAVESAGQEASTLQASFFPTWFTGQSSRTQHNKEDQELDWSQQLKQSFSPVQKDLSEALGVLLKTLPTPPTS